MVSSSTSLTTASAAADVTPQVVVSTALAPVCQLSGEWTLQRLLQVGPHNITTRLPAPDWQGQWDLRGITRLDSFGANLLWRHWQGRWPEEIDVEDKFHALITRFDREEAPLVMTEASHFSDFFVAVGNAGFALYSHVLDIIRLFGQLFLDFFYLILHPREWPLKEISANVYKIGVQAMPVTALVGFLIGVVLSYLSALQLKMFGADVYIVNILGLGIIRELGPVLVSVLVAGRSGSAMTAQLGVMRVTEEIDALSAMGISRSQRLIFPKIVALGIAMPLLAMWVCAVALLGGMVSAWVQLDLSMAFFLDTLPRAVPIANVYIALCKGVAFGLLIALIACHFGLRVRPNTESLSANTTASVVSAITSVILVDAVFAIATRAIGVPS